MPVKEGGGPVSFFLRHFFCTLFRTDEVSLSNEQMAFPAPSELPLASRVMCPLFCFDVN